MLRGARARGETLGSVLGRRCRRQDVGVYLTLSGWFLVGNQGMGAPFYPLKGIYRALFYHSPAKNQGVMHWVRQDPRNESSTSLEAEGYTRNHIRGIIRAKNVVRKC